LFLNLTDESVAVIQWGAVMCTSLVAAGFDLRQRRIPNALTFPMLATGFVFTGIFGGLASLAEAAGACVLLSLPYVLLFVFVGGGAGDAKLMGAIGAWLGLKYGLFALVCVIIAGGGLGIAKAVSRKQLKFVLTSVFVSIYAIILLLIGRRKVRPANFETDIKQSGGLELPYGVAIFAGVCIAALITGIWGVEWIW